MRASTRCRFQARPCAWIYTSATLAVGESFEHFATRVGASLLKAAGLDELIVRDTDAYVALAVELARDTKRREALFAKIAATRFAAPLFDTAGFTRDLESLYLRIWTDRTSGSKATVTAP